MNQDVVKRLEEIEDRLASLQAAQMTIAAAVIAAATGLDVNDRAVIAKAKEVHAQMHQPIRR